MNVEEKSKAVAGWDFLKGKIVQGVDVDIFGRIIELIFTDGSVIEARPDYDDDGTGFLAIKVFAPSDPRDNCQW